MGFVITILLSNTICGFAKTKIACVGDSITYGKGVANREYNSFPKKLQYMLGDDYEVKNFGLCNATVETGTIVPYSRSQEFTEAKRYNADIYVVMLGTNDAKPARFKSDREFKADYVNFLSELGKSRVIIMDVPPVNYKSDVVLTPEYTTPENVVKINRLLEDIAREQNLELIKNNKKIESIKSNVINDDGVHLNDAGAMLLAKSVYDKVKE